MKRRRFLKILGVSSLASALPLSHLLAQNNLKHRFSGEVMNGVAGVTLVHEDYRTAEQLSNRCFAEVRRLEQIFSLFLPDSSIRQLNSSGCLKNPPKELVEVMLKARKLSELSDGAFDVTLQPIWKYLFYLQDKSVDPKRLESLKQLVDYKAVSISESEISFAKPKMEITLNGIAQGYITDKVTELLKANGMKRVLVELGESYALGRNQDDRLWRIGIQNPDGTGYFKELELENQAVATSGGYGTRFGRNNSQHHLINPKTAESSNYFKSVSVVANNAIDADGLSTALSLLKRDTHRAILDSYPGAVSYIV